MNLTVAPTSDLTACLALRRAVFIVEQGVPEADELDGRDDEAVHLLAQLDGRPVGCARLLRQGETGKIGRVCVLPPARGHGIGQALMQAAVAHFRTTGAARVVLGAQTHALGFYAALGFVATGPEYHDAGILHRDMVLAL